MGNQIIIGFAGKAGAGKSAAAHALHSLGFRAMAFADPLKAAAAELFGFTWEQVNTSHGKETPDPFWGFTPRYALQRFGTEAIRGTFGESFWTQRFKQRVASETHVAVMDVRFPNEVHCIEALGGRVIRVTRPGAGFNGEAAAHPSETALDGWKFDMEIENDGTLEQLVACVIETAQEFFPVLRA